MINILTVLLLSIFFSGQSTEDITRELKVEKDKMEGITWYKSKKTSEGKSLIKKNDLFYIYFGITEKEEMILRLVAQIELMDIILFHRVVVLVNDENRYEIKFDPLKRVSDSLFSPGTRKYEKYDLLLAEEHFDMLDDIKGAKKVKIRYAGDNKYQDRELKQNEIEAIRDVWRAYLYFRENK